MEIVVIVTVMPDDVTSIGKYAMQFKVIMIWSVSNKRIKYVTPMCYECCCKTADGVSYDSL